MGRAIWLADVLRREGCLVVEVDGWQSHGSATFDPKGVIAHHTAGPTRGDMPSLGVIINGRPDVPGPLAQIGLARSGLVYVIASGRANHAGRGSWKGLSGNSSVFGIEAENTGVGEPWPQAQRTAYGLCCAALLRAMGRSTDWLCGHREWAPSRKIDPAGIDLPAGRDTVARVLALPPGQFLHGTATPTPTPDKDWFDMATEQQLRLIIRDEVGKELDERGVAPVEGGNAHGRILAALKRIEDRQKA